MILLDSISSSDYSTAKKHLDEAKEETMVDRGSSFIDALIFVLKDIRIDGWN